MAKKVEKTPAVEKTRKIVDRYFDVIISPVLTEKTMNLTQNENKVTVKVNAKSNKDEIKDAFEAIFGVKPSKVNIVVVKGKVKTFRGRSTGTQRTVKKAYVSLPADAKLDLSANI